MLRLAKNKRLGSNPSHEKHILNNLAKALIEHKQIHTTITKAKRLKPYIERIISISKKDNFINRRRIMSIVNDSTIQHILFTEIATNTTDRNSGWTRIIKTGPRKGDSTRMAMIEIILDKKTEEIKKEQEEKMKKQAEEIIKSEKKDESKNIEKKSNFSNKKDKKEPNVVNKNIKIQRKPTIKRTTSK